MRADAKRVLEQRARATFELIELGMKLMRQNLRRRFPDETEEQIEQRFVEWLHERPGAEGGDAWGRSSKPDADAILRRAAEPR
jgi:hypothetical protein